MMVLVDNFPAALAFVMRHEDAGMTGKVTVDGGGVTRWGISSRFHPGVDVRNLSFPDASAIYRTQYWQRNNLQGVNDAAVSAKLMDMVVNPGEVIIAAIQKLLHLPQAGVIGPRTLGEINLCRSDALVVLLCTIQARHYLVNCATNPDLKGLLIRAADRPLLV
jgi:lysozyme family protein